ncbi:hypothetical protein [Phytohabitans houttuyneae]|uniref:Uncharacterized protein n=1 Tax=Phytohabitans houttuyneae TaxID=1076126 RepID=A0A6V8KNK2_9ACTN|nr:hypothetical protein [Phytohabitans houttuyneae]GFJ82265.1 hypothetical protein Phou_064450 [Phytohabitans houttuyneae]
MLFQDVSIDRVVHVDAPVRLPTAEIARRLRPASERLGITADGWLWVNGRCVYQVSGLGTRALGVGAPLTPGGAPQGG